MTVRPAVFQTGPLRLDFTTRQARVHSREVHLSPHMWTLLQHLVDHDGALRTIDEVTVAIWGETPANGGGLKQTRSTDSLHRANWHRFRQLRSRLRAALGPAAYLIVSEIAATRLLILPPTLPDHFISASCQGEHCTICAAPATHKVGEEILHDDPYPVRHNLTAYVCCHCFGGIMHVDCPTSKQETPHERNSGPRSPGRHP